jgi:thiol-disulfide isomerase/thioredoxin
LSRGLSQSAGSGETANGNATEPIELTAAHGTHDSGIELHPIRYAELDAAIRRHVGKVVVVDFWMFNCPPCKAGFPYLVQLHEKYGSHGLVVISVNMDDPKRKPLREQAIAFLQEKNARFTNLGLADGEVPIQWVTLRSDPAKGGTGFEGDLPFTEVYDRKGRLVLHQVEINHDALDERVQKLLLH